MKKAGFLALALLAIVAGLVINSGLMAKGKLTPTPIFPSAGANVGCSFDVSGSADSSPVITVNTPAGGGATVTVQYDKALGLFMAHIELCDVQGADISIGITDSTGSTVISPLHVTAICPPCTGGGGGNDDKEITPSSVEPPLAK